MKTRHIFGLFLIAVILALLFVIVYQAANSYEPPTITTVSQPNGGYVLQGVKETISQDCRLTNAEINQVNWPEIPLYHPELNDTQTLTLKFMLNHRTIYATYKFDEDTKTLNLVQCPR